MSLERGEASRRVYCFRKRPDRQPSMLAFTRLRSTSCASAILAKGREVTDQNTTLVLGIAMPSTDALFLTIVGIHIVFGLAAVITGAVAMLIKKGRGRHSNWGTFYF
jgi:hypothetical protein